MTNVKSFAISALAMASIAAMAQNYQQQVRVVIDGEPVQFRGEQPSETDGRVLVPLRGVFEKLGARVNWDPTNQTITARKNGVRVRLTIGELDASINGRDKRMDIAATLVDGATMVPLRFVSEALGAFVTWDQDNHEVDIKSSVDYNLERPPTPPPPPPTPPPPPPPPPVVIVQPPPPPPPPAQTRPLRIVHNYREIKADTVIPLTLETQLSSRDSKPGDPFTARLDTHGASHYLDLPEGTQVYGSVAYVKKQHRRIPGVIELRFNHLMLPSGRSLPINGRLIGLDNVSVMHRNDGELVAASEQRGSTTVFVATSMSTSVIVGLQTRRPLEDNMITGLLESALEPSERSRLARDVDLHQGTPMGLRLYDSVIIPRDGE